jgi:hypothetical protein
MKRGESKWVDYRMYSADERSKLSFPMPSRGSDVHMFIEDVYRLLFGKGTNELTFEKPIDGLAREVLGDVIGIKLHRHDSNYRIEKFLEEIVRNLISFGIAPFEPVYDDWTQITSLSRVSAFSVIRKGDQFYQLLPANSNNGITELRELKNVTYCELPSDLESVRLITLNGLPLVGLESFPKFAVEYDVYPTSGVDFDYHKKTTDQAFASVARISGWLGRGRLRDHTYGFYRVHQALKFLAFKFKIRDIAIDFLENQFKANQELRDVRIKRTPSVEAVQNAIAQVSLGEIWVSEIESNLEIHLPQ